MTIALQISCSKLRLLTKKFLKVSSNGSWFNQPPTLQQQQQQYQKSQSGSNPGYGENPLGSTTPNEPCNDWSKFSQDSNAVSEHKVGIGSLEGRVLHQNSSLLFKCRKKKDCFRKIPVQSIIRINGWILTLSYLNQRAMKYILLLHHLIIPSKPC